MNNSDVYGLGDNTFQAAGGEAGVRALVDSFYDIMASDSRFTTIMSWHPNDVIMTRDKLSMFLCAWMGGGSAYTRKHGPVNIPRVHRHLSVTEVERDQWLLCMQEALAQQNYPDSLVEYLLHQLSIPAERIRQVCVAHKDA